MNALEQQRFNMIEQQIRPWDVLNPTILALLAHVHREDFIAEEYRAMTFVDMALPILPTAQQPAHSDTRKMLQPKMEGRILQEVDIQPNERVLMLGANSGYLAALVAELGQHVTIVESDTAIIAQVNQALAQHPHASISVIEGNMAHGLPHQMPFDVIILTDATYTIPTALRDQLAVNGRLFAVVGQAPIMSAQVITRLSQTEYRTLTVFDTLLDYLPDLPRPAAFVF
jgi:protein-L-isoaspartate(D-aspartate) O-methyltransferase